VRDLPSSLHLAWWPLAAASAEATATVLTERFAEHGPPLVLKSDNGSAFTAALLHDLLAAPGVQPLFSPPGWPAHNGGIEARIGSLKEVSVRPTA
jgi:transposase InsO family protein